MMGALLANRLARLAATPAASSQNGPFRRVWTWIRHRSTIAVVDAPQRPVELWTVAAVAEYCHDHRQTVHLWVREHRLVPVSRASLGHGRTLLLFDPEIVRAWQADRKLSTGQGHLSTGD